MRRYVAFTLALLFYASVLPSSAEFYNYNAKNITGDNTGTLQGFKQIGSSAFTDNLTLYANDVIAKGPWVDVRAYSSLSAANTSAVALGRCLLIDNAVTVSDNTTLTAPVVVIPGGSFDISNGVTLTFDNSFTSDMNQQVFVNHTAKTTAVDNNGDPIAWTGAQVRFASSSTLYISPKWYGAKGDGVTSDQTAFWLASDSCSKSGIAMWIPRATYLNPYVLLFNDGYNVHGNNSTFINDGTSIWNPIQLGDNYFRGKGSLHPGVIETTATDNLLMGAYTLNVTSTTGISVGDWVLVHAGTETHSSAQNYIPKYKQYFKVVSKTDTQFTFGTVAKKTLLLSDDLRVTHAQNVPKNVVVEGIIISGAWSTACQLAVMSSINVTIRDCQFLADCAWGIATFSHNVLFDHVMVRAYGGWGTGRGTTKFTVQNSWIETRAESASNYHGWMEENPEEITVNNCTLLNGAFVYANNDSTDVKFIFTNNHVFSPTGVALSINGFYGYAKIDGNYFKADGLTTTGIAYKSLVHLFYTASDTGHELMFSNNTFEGITGDAVLFGLGAGAGGAASVHMVNNRTINVLGDTMTRVSNIGIEHGPFSTMQRSSIVDVWIDTQDISLDNTLLGYTYQLDNIASQVPAWTYNSTSKTFLLNIEAVGRGTSNDNVYYVYKGVATVSTGNAVSVTATVPTLVSSVSGGADASIAITSPSATQIKITLTVANQPMDIVVRVNMLNPKKVLPY